MEQVSLPSGEVIPVDYRMKTGCEAKITIRRILRYVLWVGLVFVQIGARRN